MACLNVKSEIGKLRKALVRRPGRETQHYPHGDFLQVFPLRPFQSSFDLDEAQREHDRLVGILKEHGVEVVDLTDLVVEALDSAPQARDRLITTYLQDCRIEGTELTEAARAYLESAETSERLVSRLFGGIRYSDTELVRRDQFPFASHIGAGFDPETFLTSPLNTSFFVRDPMSVIGDGVTLNHMYWHDRNREVDLCETVVDFNPEFKAAPRWFDHDCSFHLEGGDILNIDAHTVAVGLSERTEAAAIDALCRKLLDAENGSTIDSVYVFAVPQIGNRLHLDTYLARIDYDLFVIDPSLAQGIEAYRISRGGRTTGLAVEALGGSASSILGRMLGENSVRLLQFGAGQSSRMDAEYSNGAMGMLCLAPGDLCVCEENVLTNDILDKAGMKLHPVSIQEMTVGFGGPASLCQPLWREDL